MSINFDFWKHFYGFQSEIDDLNSFLKYKSISWLHTSFFFYKLIIRKQKLVNILRLYGNQKLTKNFNMKVVFTIIMLKKVVEENTR